MKNTSEQNDISELNGKEGISHESPQLFKGAEAAFNSLNAHRQ